MLVQYPTVEMVKCKGKHIFLRVFGWFGKVNKTTTTRIPSSKASLYAKAFQSFRNITRGGRRFDLRVGPS